MLRTIIKIRNNPDKALAHIKAACSSKQIAETQRGSSFIGKATLTASQLDYAIQCARETQAKRTW